MSIKRLVLKQTNDGIEASAYTAYTPATRSIHCDSFRTTHISENNRESGRKMVENCRHEHLGERCSIISTNRWQAGSDKSAPARYRICDAHPTHHGDRRRPKSGPMTKLVAHYPRAIVQSASSKADYLGGWRPARDPLGDGDENKRSNFVWDFGWRK